MNRAFDHNGVTVSASKPHKELRTVKKTLLIDSADRDVLKYSAGGDFVELVEPGHRVTIKSSKDIWYEIEWKEQIAYIKKEDVTRL